MSLLSINIKIQHPLKSRDLSTFTGQKDTKKNHNQETTNSD